jgi:pilus assembly protein CpaB
MKARSNLVLLAIAMALSLITTLLILHRLSLTTNSTSDKGVPVVVVKHALSAHEVVTNEDVSVQNLPKGALSPGSFTRLGEVVGHFTTGQWFIGQQVVSGMITNSGKPDEFPLQIPQGYRAFTISDDPVVGVDHLISKGDHVDVLVSYTNQGAKASTTRTILQNIAVLNVDFGPVNASDASSSGTQSGNMHGTASSSKIDTLTLAVTPEQSEQLDYAYTFGQLHVVLRSPSDDTVTSLASVTGAGQ